MIQLVLIVACMHTGLHNSLKQFTIIVELMQELLQGKLLDRSFFKGSI